MQEYLFQLPFVVIEKQSQLKIHYQGSHYINYAVSIHWNNTQQLKRKQWVNI